MREESSHKAHSNCISKSPEPTTRGFLPKQMLYVQMRRNKRLDLNLEPGGQKVVVVKKSPQLENGGGDVGTSKERIMAMNWL